MPRNVTVRHVEMQRNRYVNLWCLDYNFSHIFESSKPSVFSPAKVYFLFYSNPQGNKIITSCLSIWYFNMHLQDNTTNTEIINRLIRNDRKNCLASHLSVEVAHISPRSAQRKTKLRQNCCLN